MSEVRSENNFNAIRRNALALLLLATACDDEGNKDTETTGTTGDDTHVSTTGDTSNFDSSSQSSDSSGVMTSTNGPEDNDGSTSTTDTGGDAQQCGPLKFDPKLSTLLFNGGQIYGSVTTPLMISGVNYIYNCFDSQKVIECPYELNSDQWKCDVEIIDLMGQGFMDCNITVFPTDLNGQPGPNESMNFQVTE